MKSAENLSEMKSLIKPEKYILRLYNICHDHLSSDRSVSLSSFILKTSHPIPSHSSPNHPVTNGWFQNPDMDEILI